MTRNFRGFICGIFCLLTSPVVASPACNVLNHLAAIDASSARFLTADTLGDRDQAIARMEGLLGKLDAYDLLERNVRANNFTVTRIVASRHGLVRAYRFSGTPAALRTARSELYVLAGVSLEAMRREQGCVRRPDSESTNTSGQQRDAAKKVEPLGLPVRISLALTALFSALGAYRGHQHIKIRGSILSRRRSRRYACCLETEVLIGEEFHQGVICDASRHGAKIKIALPYAKGEAFSVKIGEAWLIGTVRWSTEQYIGIEFGRSLTDAELSAITQSNLRAGWRLG